MVTVEQVRQLPYYWEQVIPAEFLDEMGHMNIQFYLHLYERGATKLFEHFGFHPEYVERERNGMFALEQHLRYLAEVHVGQTVRLHYRMLNANHKRLHFMGFMVNETTQQLASMFESVGSHADLETRRTSPFPPELAANLATMIAAHHCDWDPPLNGAMGI